MLFISAHLEGIAAGSISLAFRRWTKPTVKAGGRLRTAVGVLAIDAVDIIDVKDISAKDAARAGYSSKEELLTELAKRKDGQLYRIQFRLSGSDERIALRENDSLDEAALAALRKRLQRFDASAPQPWTIRVLNAIADQPGTRASDLAESLGYEKMWLKVHIRKLKELGLTESLIVGYRLSPRGQKVLERLTH